MRKLTIMCDVDAIIADLIPHWLQTIGDVTGVHAKVEELTEYDATEWPPYVGKVPFEKIMEVLNTEGFTIKIPVMPGAVEGVRKLMDDGHEIYFVTARHGKHIMPETFRWFSQHFPFVDIQSQLVFLKDKYRFNADVIIDDSPKNLEKYWGAHAFAQCIGITYPYNTQLEALPQYRMVPYGHKAWNNITKIIDRTAKSEYGTGYTEADIAEMSGN